MRFDNNKLHVIVQIIRGYTSLLFLVIISISFYFIIDGEIVNKGGNNRIYEEYRPSESNDNYSFAELADINPEVESWIIIEGTRIDYPVVHADNNKKYLSLNALGEFQASGSIFIDCDNRSNFQDFNTIIYGHNMSNGYMFGDLNKYNKKEFFKRHNGGCLIYENKKHYIEFFAFISDANGYDKNIYNPGIVGKEQINSYLKYIENSAKYYTDTHINENDKIILLSTCNHVITNGRTILVGKICSDGPKAKMLLKKKKKIHAYSWMYILEALLCILLVIVLYEKKK